MKKVLMVAFHFPPLAGSSGIQRTLRFAQHLPRFGWQPMVLTTRELAYPQRRDDLIADIPPGLRVRRAWAFDCARHFSLFGRYPAAWARPDRWASWRIDGVRAGLDMIEREQPHLLWSTYPIASAHVIGAELAARSGLPWVADFRDPMAQDGYPADPVTWAMWARIERTAIERSARAIFVTRGARRFYRERYPAIPDQKLQVIENGFDEDSFAGLTDRGPRRSTPLVLLHSGVIYPAERDPVPLFRAIRQLRDGGLPRFELHLRAPGDINWISRLIDQHGVSDVVRALPPVGYREALQEMLDADGLVVMQAANCNDQIPAKLYEYFRAHRPILALVDPAGDTAQRMREAHAAGSARIADPASVEAIGRALSDFTHDIAHGTASAPLESSVKDASRLAATQRLAHTFDEILSGEMTR